MTDFFTPDTRDLELPAKNEQEIWESNIEGCTWVETTDHRGAPRMKSVTGAGQRLRLTSHDRVRAQERIRQLEHDPFTNGSLRRVDRNQNDDEGTKTENALSEADLELIFGLDFEDFKEEVEKLSEINHRRLKAMAPVHATMQQGQHLQELIEERYHIGGDTPTYREMMAAPK
jgi:hypothetical protein